MSRPHPLIPFWQSDDLLAIHKPPGLATTPGRAEATSVIQQLPPGTRLIHRLDKDTSGLLLLAKSRDAQRHLCQQFLHRTIQKEYLALVEGVPLKDSGHINAPLLRHPAQHERIIITKHGQSAITDWEVVERFRTLALLRCLPKTGRTHQIRVHLKSIGLPLAIDPLYGGFSGLYLSSFKSNYKENSTPERPLIDRLTLHAHRLSFLDVAGKPTTLTCPPPKDFRAAINQLTKYGS